MPYIGGKVMRWGLVPTVGVGLLFVGFAVRTSQAERDAASPRYQPRGERRLVMYYDPQGLWYPTLSTMNPASKAWQDDPASWKTGVETIVDAHADAGVDTIVHCIFSRFSTNVAPDVSKVAEPIYDQVPYTEPLKRYHEAGYDLMQILVDRAHERGLTLMAGMRMNDRHGAATRAKLYLEHPEWHAQGVPRGLDYAHEGLRNKVLTFIREVLDRYDVDGIEFDYMRWIYMFSMDEERQGALLLTDFQRKARKLLDEAGRKRGRRLLLSARVPDRLEECEWYGFDVKTWVKEGLVDYLVPSHFGYMDANVKIEEYRELTEGTDCRIYPSLNRWTGPSRLDKLAKGAGWRPEHYYATARNYYGFGADGIATYNYQFARFEENIEKLTELSPVRDPRTLAGRHRDYRFFHRVIGKVHPNNPVGNIKYDVIHLDRSKPGTVGTFAFRIAEDLSGVRPSAAMDFKAVGMVDQDDIEVSLNGKKVSPENLTRIHIWDGTNKDKEHEPYDLIRIDLNGDRVVYGDNELGVVLTKAGQEGGVIRIEEVGISVHP